MKTLLLSDVAFTFSTFTFTVAAENNILRDALCRSHAVLGLQYYATGRLYGILFLLTIILTRYHLKLSQIH